MSAFPDILDRSIGSFPEGLPAAGPAFELDETYWGYVVRDTSAMPLPILVLQGAAWAAGLVSAASALALWLLSDPTAGTPGDLRIGATMLLAGFAGLMFWFASRGARSELQIDTSLGEVREVVRNRAGRPTLLGRYGFDAISGLSLDRTSTWGRVPAGHACLVLRYRETGEALPVAIALESLLVPLRDRIAQDMMLRTRSFARPPATDPFDELRAA